MSSPKRRATDRLTSRKPTKGVKASPRPRAPDETKAALVAAAARLFLRDGLDVPSLDAICEEAGKTRGAFYVHFRSREDLVAAVVELALTELLDRIVRPDQDLTAIVRSFVAALSAGALPLSPEMRFSQVLEASVRSPELRVRFLAMLLIAKGRIADAVERSIASGSVDASRDPHAVAEMLLAIVLGVQAAAQLGAPYDAASVEREVLAMLAPPGSSSKATRTKKTR
ncbi:MAG: TetR/AcrR family transcriptional regulator [Deltaproteobacteria bacterium]|nr:TetR/AcrR family transcriptional regulator [Deltaproteobacteria bacterium]